MYKQTALKDNNFNSLGVEIRISDEQFVQEMEKVNPIDIFDKTVKTVRVT